MSDSNRIPAGKSHAYNAWHLPAVEDGVVVAVERRERGGNPQRDEVVYTSITAGHLESITRQGFEEGRREGYKTGFAEGRAAGFAQGEREGLQAGRQQIQQQLAVLAGVMRDLLEPLAAQRDATEQALVELAGALALTLFHRELEPAATGLAALVREAVAALPAGARELCVYLHPDDRALLQDSGQFPDHWRLLSDPGQSRGGCRVETDHSVVDNTPEQRLARVLQRLFSDRNG
ncbi:MAG TPA: FliH/SctL family protein [Spongiibacteraceae bacterium]|nr:FliH/SctL family protein [Spongiibacteraceae bacterium]